MGWVVSLGSGSVAGLGSLVGVDLVNWIVDASILRQLYTRSCRDLAASDPLRLIGPCSGVGGWVVGCLVFVVLLCSFC